jgi:hypothetical protein
VQIMSTVWRALLGLMATAASLHAQSLPSRHTEADSAAVLAATVDRILGIDLESPRRVSSDSSVGTQKATHLRVFVRIARVPRGAWATPSIARLRAWQWRFKGWAIDSTSADAERGERPGSHLSVAFPAELSLTLEFTGDTALVTQYWDIQTCGTHSGIHGIFVDRHVIARTPLGWRWVESRGGGVMDVLCG